MRDDESFPIHPRSIHEWLMVAFAGVLLVGFALSLFKQQWMNAALIAGIIVLTTLPQLLRSRIHVVIPTEFQFLANVLIFGSLFLGEMHGYYARFWWWDLALHGGSGLLLGIFGFLLVHVLNQQAKIALHMEMGFVAFFSFTFSVAMGSLWELFEFAMDYFFGLNMQKSGLPDTMGDMLMNSTGALLISLAGYFYFKSDKTYFLEEWIARFIDRNPKIFRKIAIPKRD